MTTWGEPSHNQLFVRLESPSRGLAQICEYIETQIIPLLNPVFILLHLSNQVHSSVRVFL